MLKALRGLVLAAGVVALPAYAQVDCPTEDSIDRYAQTARDALAALDGLVPESQQRALESRYAAMSVLKWSWQGRDAVTSDAPALNRLAACLSSGPCDAEASERNRNLGQFPSDRLFTWARVELGCQPAAPEIVDEPAEPEDAETVSNEPAPVASPEPAESENETPVVETEVFEPIEAPEPAIEVVEQEAELPEPEIEDITTLAPPPNEGAATGSRAAMRTATLLLMKGNFSRAADIVRKACFVDAATTDPAATCESLFDVYHRMATRANPEEFLDFTNQLCTLNYERGCTSMARYFGADTTFEALLAAFNHYNRSCNSGDAEACAIVSDYHVAGRISAADLVLARETLERACSLGRLASCQGLADYYLRGVGGDVDVTRALDINAASCPETGKTEPDTCVQAADFVVINLEDGPEKNTLVRAFTQRACETGHGAGCAWYADALEFGIGGDVDLPAAKQARLTACEFGHEESCTARS